MPIDDFSLALYDEPASEMAARAIERFQALVPGWTAEPGRLERAILDTNAAVSASALYSANRAPLATAKGILAMLGTLPDSGQAPTATVSFFVSAACTVPANFRVRAEINTPQPVVVDFETTVSATAVGAGTLTIAVRGLTNTAAANGLPLGTDLVPLSSLFQLDRCELAAPVGGGRDPETEDEWYARSANRFDRLTDTLNSASHFAAYIAEQPGVAQVLAADQYNPAIITPEPHLGQITIGAISTAGGVMSLVDRNTIIATVTDMTPVDLTITWLDPTISPIDYTINVRAFPGYSDAEIIAAVQAKIGEWLDPTVTPLGSEILANEALAQVDTVQGVDTVLSLTQNRPASAVAAAIQLGRFETATAGTVTVTVSP